MPMETREKSKEPKVVVSNSATIELFSILRLLVDKELGEDIDDELYRDMQHKIKLKGSFVDCLKALRNNGVEFLEFVMLFRILDDIDELLRKIKALDEVDFLYYFFGEEINRQQIQSIREDHERLRFYWENGLKGHVYDVDVARLIVTDTPVFLEEFFNAIELIRQVGFEARLDAVFLKHNAIAEDIRQQLKDSKPLELCQKLMNKTFARVSIYNKYYFVPSSYIGRYHTRFFNSETLIMIINVQNTFDGFTSEADMLDFLKTIGDKNRLSILKLLSKNKLYGKELADILKLNNATVSHHLNLMKDAGILIEEKEAQVKFYKTNNTRISRWFRSIEKYIRQ